MSPRSDSVGVVIVNRNGGEHLARALECVLAQTVPATRVIVVDNASSDGSLDGLDEHFSSVELVRSDANLGFAAANNLAVRRCDDCDLVALVNPDAFVASNWLASMTAAAAAHPDCAFFGSRMLLDADADVLDGTGDLYHVGGVARRRDRGAAATFEREGGEVFSACAAAVVYRRDAFLAVGGFDESFFCFYEDTDLAFRLRLAGHRGIYVPDAIARHVGSAAAGSVSDFTVYHSCRNQVWTFAKNMPRPLLWLYAPQHLLVNVLTVAAYAAQGRGRAALAGKWDAVRGLPRVRVERQRVQAARRVRAWELRRLMARGPAAYLHTYLARARDWRGQRDLPAAVAPITRSR